MNGVQAALLGLVAAGVVFGGGWFAIHQMRAGFDYMSSRGNPRNRAAAHESIRDNLIGLVLVLSAAAISIPLVAIAGRAATNNTVPAPAPVAAAQPAVFHILASSVGAYDLSQVE
jgi:ABC-type Fe3+ transport system permease subunit